MADSSTNLKAPLPLVVIAGWLLPGAGYWLIGQRSRALATGLTVICVYLAGLLIGGIRVIEVPGFDDRGQKVQVELDRPLYPRVWIMAASPMQEVKAKPWSIAQVLAGPIGIASGAASVWTAQPGSNQNSITGSIADVSHTPVNEAGTLYTAVAGMLNLLVIIDSAHRATQGGEA